MPIDPFFDDLKPKSSCWLCQRDPEMGFVDDLLRGMAGTGPYAEYLSPDTEFAALFRRVSNAELMKVRGLEPYPRARYAFETHCKVHRKELWDAVEAARRS